jgi:hypothetical protein
VIAAQIVKRLLEDGEDPKEFLDNNRDLGLDQVFVMHGWVVRGPGEYGKMSGGVRSQDGDVRWIVNIEDRTGRPTATFSGEKLFEGTDKYGREWREWQEFDIPDYVVYSSWMTADQFVTEIEEYLLDHKGPDDPHVPEPDFDDVDD